MTYAFVNRQWTEESVHKMQAALMFFPIYVIAEWLGLSKYMDTELEDEFVLEHEPDFEWEHARIVWWEVGTVQEQG